MTGVDDSFNPTPSEIPEVEQWKWEEIEINGETKKKLNFIIEIYKPSSLKLTIHGIHINDNNCYRFFGPTFTIDMSNNYCVTYVDQDNLIDASEDHQFDISTDNCKYDNCNLTCNHEYTYDNYCLLCGKEDTYSNNITNIIEFTMNNYYNEGKYAISTVNTQQQYNNRPTIRKLKNLIEELKQDPDNTKNITEIEKYIKKLK